MKNGMPEKPETQRAQIDMLWDTMHNHVLSRLKWADTKINFIMGFMALVLVILGVLATLIVWS